MSSADQDHALMAAVTSLSPHGGWQYDHGQGLPGLIWLDPKLPRPSDAEISAEMTRLAAQPAVPPPGAAARLETHLAAAISEFSAPAPANNQGSEAMTTTGPGAHALTIKQVLEEHGKKLDQVLQAQLALLTSELDGQLGTVMSGTEAVISKIRGNTDDFKAILGQFTNEI